MNMAYENLQLLMNAQTPRMRKADLAKLLTRDNAVVTNIFKGIRPISTEEAKKLASYFGVSIDIILDSSPYMSAVDVSDGMALPKAKPWRTESDIIGNTKPVKKMVSLRGFVAAADDTVEVYNYAEDEIEQVECPPFLDPTNLEAYQTKGSSQEPLILDNWLLYIYRNKVFPGVPSEYIGELCMVKILADGEATGKTVVKFVAKGSSPGYYTLYSRNERIPPIVDVIIEHCAAIAGSTPRKRLI